MRVEQRPTSAGERVVAQSWRAFLVCCQHSARRRSVSKKSRHKKSTAPTRPAGSGFAEFPAVCPQNLPRWSGAVRRHATIAPGAASDARIVPRTRATFLPGVREPVSFRSRASPASPPGPAKVRNREPDLISHRCDYGRSAARRADELRCRRHGRGSRRRSARATPAVPGR